MESIVRYDFKPDLDSPAFVECLPGIGGVGKIGGDFFAASVGAKKFASIYSRHFPSYVALDGDSVAHMPCNELWHSKRGDGGDMVFLIGDYQGNTSEGQFDLARDVMDVLLRLGVSDITTLGGYGTGYIVREPRVLGAVSDPKMKRQYKKWGVDFVPGEPRAGIVGASGVMLGFGKMYGIPSACLMGETAGHVADYRSALAVARVLAKKFGTDPDFSDLEERARDLDALTAQIEEYSRIRPEEDLNYIG
ncbi:MAG: PAC2 family protein [Candidatus Methanoplasma sp.]|nr:PAC2 family protein [Candidatus Methanoplasma sp.]